MHHKIKPFISWQTPAPLFGKAVEAACHLFRLCGGLQPPRFRRVFLVFLEQGARLQPTLGQAKNHGQEALRLKFMSPTMEQILLSFG